MMTARLVMAIALTMLSSAAAAQSRDNLRPHGQVNILEISSAEIPDLLTMVKKRINTGMADKWEMPSEVLFQDIVVAKSIIFQKGRLILSPRNINDDNIILVVGDSIRFEGPLELIWDRNIGAQIREPIRFGKAAPGAPGEREGAPGKPGADGVPGNRGLTGRDAPSIVFVAKKIEQAPWASVRFQLLGQDGGPGGTGQDGGDGGPGRQGRPGLLVTTGIGVTIKQTSACTPVIHGGNGGDGGNGGPGGEGGTGGDGGSVVFISMDVTGELVEKIVDKSSSLQPGKNGPRGPRGGGGKGGLGAPQVLGSASCQPSNAGKDGRSGQGPGGELPKAGPDHTKGESGTIVFSTINELQAKSILDPERK